MRQSEIVPRSGINYGDQICGLTNSLGSQDHETRRDCVLVADRRFFERHSGRRLRLRFASRTEVAELRQAGRHGAISPSKRLYVLVMVADADPCQRIRLFGLGDPEWETDLSEEACRNILANVELQQGPWHGAQARAVYRVREDRDDR